jgi:hypothetical protein
MRTCGAPRSDPQPAQHLDGLLDRRLFDIDRREAPLQGAIALDVLAVLVQRRGADAAQLAARQRRLHHVGGVDGALRRPRAHHGVQLVDEEDDLALGLRSRRARP